MRVSSKIRCIHFNDDDRVDILDKKEVDRGIIGNIEFAEEYLKERVPVRYEIKELRRKEFPEYPLEAYREAIVNSIIHFDYFLGDTIAIEKLKNSIVINNKGELLFPETDFGKRSEPRNRLLSDLLAKTDFMEKAGTGIKRVRDACSDNGNKVSFRFTDAFWITMHSNKSVTESVTENVTENVTEKRLFQIMKEIEYNPRISYDQLCKILGVARMTVYRDLESLKEEGKIKRIGPAKGGHWEVIK